MLYLTYRLLNFFSPLGGKILSLLRLSSSLEDLFLKNSICFMVPPVHPSVGNELLRIFPTAPQLHTSDTFVPDKLKWWAPEWDSQAALGEIAKIQQFPAFFELQQAQGGCFYKSIEGQVLRNPIGAEFLYFQVREGEFQTQPLRNSNLYILPIHGSNMRGNTTDFHNYSHWALSYLQKGFTLHADLALPADQGKEVVFFEITCRESNWSDTLTYKIERQQGPVPGCPDQFKVTFNVAPNSPEMEKTLKQLLLIFKQPYLFHNGTYGNRNAIAAAFYVSATRQRFI